VFFVNAYVGLRFWSGVFWVASRLILLCRGLSYEAWETVSQVTSGQTAGSVIKRMRLLNFGTSLSHGGLNCEVAEMVEASSN